MMKLGAVNDRRAPLKRLDRWLGSRGRGFLIAAALFLLALVSWLDYVSGSEVAFAIFYLAPVSLVSWYVGRPLGSLFALLGSVCWWGAEVMSHRVYSDPAIAYWNALVRLGFFLIVNSLLASVRWEMTRYRQLSERDPLTGAYNRRMFTVLAESELQRVGRYGRPLSLAYIDLDSFKKVNDQMGHDTGDLVLIEVVKVLRQNLRQLDIVARIGGDEFLVLMPETTSEQARAVVERLLEQGRASMACSGWPIGFSIGVVTCQTGLDLQEMIRLADAEMYRSKLSGKGVAYFFEYRSSAPVGAESLL